MTCLPSLCKCGKEAVAVGAECGTNVTRGFCLKCLQTDLEFALEDFDFLKN